MKNRKIHYRTTIPVLLIALVLGCFPLSSAVRANDGHSIVGLWYVEYLFSDGTPFTQAYDQWHRDGQEFEVSNLAAGVVCQGTWENAPHRSVQLFHVGWLSNSPGDGSVYGRFEETQTNMVSADGNSYDGMWHEKDYDLDGNLIGEEGGTLHATRLSVGDPR